MAAWASLLDGGLRVRLKVFPRSRGNGVKGVDVDAGGRAALKVQVTAAPEGGRANAAVIRFLAKRWRVAAGRFTLVSGAAARQKIIEIVDGDQDLLDNIGKIEETVGT